MNHTVRLNCADFLENQVHSHFCSLSKCYCMEYIFIGNITKSIFTKIKKKQNLRIANFVFSCKSGEFNECFIGMHSVVSCIDIILQVKRRHGILSILPTYTGSVASGSRCTCALYKWSYMLVTCMAWLNCMEVAELQRKKVCVGGVFSHLSGQFFKYSYVAT